MNNFSYDELKIILAFYYFDAKKNRNNIEQFTKHFNTYFNKDVSQQSIIYTVSIFKNMDSSFVAKPVKNNNPMFEDLWNHYILCDRIKSLKNQYVEFKSDKRKNCLFELTSEEMLVQVNAQINAESFNYVGDTIKLLYDSDKSITQKAHIRDLNVVINSLKLANYLCEYNTLHPLFLRKNIDINYTEAHHLIPLKYQNLFNVNIDVEANVVSLCSNCHNQLHYGRDIEKILFKLYANRKERLKKCGIIVSYEELVSFYKSD